MKLTWVQKIIIGRILARLRKEEKMKDVVKFFAGKKTYIFTVLYAMAAITEFLAAGVFTIESCSMLAQEIAASGGAAAFRAGIKKIGTNGES